MEKSIDQTVEERRAYVKKIRASFQNHEQRSNTYTHQEEDSKEAAEYSHSTLGIRTIVALLLFAAFVYCDQEKLSFQQYQTTDVFSQIEWNPLPIGNLDILKDTADR